jgi:Cu2+-exporting ATPase
MHTHHDHSEQHHGGRSDPSHAGHSVAMFRDKFWVSFVLTLPTLVGHVQNAFGYHARHVPR